MLRGLLVFLFLLLVFTGSASATDPAAEMGWGTIAPGIEYQKFFLPEPNTAFVVRMDRSNPTVTLESMIAQGKLAEGRETVSGMYARYDQAINYWGGRANPTTWGMRSQAVVAINGSYFDWNNGLPQGGQVQSGWYAKRYDNLGGWSGFAWRLDRTAFIGECVNHNPLKQFITYPGTGNTQSIELVNEPRDWDKLTLYTPQYNTRTGTDDSGVEVLVEMTRPTLILPDPAFAFGIVRQVRSGAGNSYIPFNHIVLSANGDAGQTLQSNVQVGSEIRVTQEITSYLDDCVTPYNISWTKTYAAIQGAYFYLKSGEIRQFYDDGAINRNPRTAIAFTDQYIYFIVVDGRHYNVSVGMTINELAVFTRDFLGASWGVAQDGGGSSTMVINGQVVNNTFCNIYSCFGAYKSYLPVVVRETPMEASNITDIDSDISSAPEIVERAVANGMLMLVAQPPIFSAVFTPGSVVTTVASTELRLGPGTNYPGYTTIPAGTNVTILEQMNGLQGVLAKSSYWWYVNYAGLTGWVPESVLAALGAD